MVPSENFPTVQVIDNEVINYFDLKLVEIEGMDGNYCDKLRDLLCSTMYC